MLSEAIADAVEKLIGQLTQAAHENAKAKGFYGVPFNVAEKLALIHSEISEVLEEFRDGAEPASIRYECELGKAECPDKACRLCEQGIPAGIPIELADVVIRVFDLAGYYGIDLGRAIVQKMLYNQHRPIRHGKKF